MQLRPRVYDRAHLLTRARLYLAYALAEGGAPSMAERIAECTQQALASLRLEAPWVLRDILTDLVLVDAPRATDLARHMFRDLGTDVLDTIADVQLLRQLPEARAALLDRAELSTRTPAERFADFKRALEASLRAQDEERARVALDGLESLTDGVPEATRLLEMLDSRAAVGSIWDEDEIDAARARILEGLGQMHTAASVLGQLGHRLITRGGPHHLLAVEGLMDRIRAGGEEPDPAVVARLREATRAEPPRVARDGVVGTVFVLGGNETQERYADRLLTWARAQWPGVTLAIETPGWSSNWGRERDRYERRIRAAKAVVLLQLLRTECGRWARRMCSVVDVPWVPCTGHGLQALEKSIEKAVSLIS